MFDKVVIKYEKKRKKFVNYNDNYYCYCSSFNSCNGES